MKLQILHRDEHCVVINKPAGLLVHRSRIAKRETEFALQILRDQIGQPVYPAHRLDRPTSGVLVFALSSEVARAFGEIFAQRRVVKRYIALVRGYSAAELTIDAPLKEVQDRKSDRRARRDKPPQSATSELRTIRQIELPWGLSRYPTSRYSLVELRPKTGRRHQLRRHLKLIAKPIIGDSEHGDHRHNHHFRDTLSISRMLLVARELELRHPVTGEALHWRAPLGEEFRRVFQLFGWRDLALNPGKL